ncbi:MAG: ankyrin repeat domain-containing protein [Candidatus Babeliales bacterium]|jgi:ankyrin repeat protein
MSQNTTFKLCVAIILTLSTTSTPLPGALKNHDISQYLRDAVKENDFEKAYEMLTNGADANAIDGHGTFPLHTAASNGNFAIVALLIIYNANVNQRNSRRLSPLLKALDDNGDYDNNDEATSSHFIAGNNNRTYAKSSNS